MAFHCSESAARAEILPTIKVPSRMILCIPAFDIHGAVRAGTELVSAVLWTSVAFALLVWLILGVGYAAGVITLVVWLAGWVLPDKLRSHIGVIAKDLMWVCGTGTDMMDFGDDLRISEGRHLVSRSPTLFPCETVLLPVSESDRDDLTSDEVTACKKRCTHSGSGAHVFLAALSPFTGSDEALFNADLHTVKGAIDARGNGLHTHLVSDQKGRTRYCLCGTPLAHAIGVVVLLHGVSMTCDMWAEYCEELGGRGYAVLVYDMWGHGHSTVLQGPRYTPELLCAQLRELLSALLIDTKVHLVGFSLGSLVATLFATRYPDCIHTLTLIAPAAGFNNAREDFVSRNVSLNLLQKGLWAYRNVPFMPSVATYLGRVILHSLAEHVGPTPAHLLALRDAQFAVHGHMRLLQYVNALRYLGGQWLYQHKLALRHDVLRSFVCEGDLLGDYSPLVSQLQQAQHPILVVYASDDALVPPSVQERLATGLSQASITVVEGAGHNVPMHGKDELLQALTSFLSGSTSCCES